MKENGVAGAHPAKSSKEDRFQGHDYYGVDDLLQEDHLLARQAVRDWVKQEVSPIIEGYFDRAECPQHLFKGLAEIGAFGPSLPGRNRVWHHYAGTGKGRFGNPVHGLRSRLFGDVPYL
jgi:hypothetical protein